jgi:hypothetical protein
LEYKKLKQEQIFKAVRFMFKNHEIEIRKEVYDEYHLENNTLKELILKFMTKMQAIFMHNKLFNRKSVARKDKIPKTEKKQRNNKANKSDINLSDNSGIGNKSEDKALSDTEAVIKSKENFFNVLQSITKNMLKEVGNKQKVSVTVEPTVMPEFGEMLSKYKEPEPSMNKSNEIVRESEIQIIVGEYKVRDLQQHNHSELIESKMKTGVPEDTFKPKESVKEKIVEKKEEVKIADMVKTTTQENKQGNTNKLKNKNKKENCECKCLIF